jgi:hypothetical protein
MPITGWRLTRRCGILVAAVAAATVATAGIAAASPASMAVHHATVTARHIAIQRTFAVPAGSGSVTVSAGSAHAMVTRNPDASPDITISCTLTVFNPLFYSGEPYGEGVEGTAEIECTGVVSELYIEVGLFYQGTLVSETYNENYDTTLVSDGAEYPYAEGYYETAAIGTVYYPAGYSPSTGNVGGDSPEVFIDVYRVGAPRVAGRHSPPRGQPGLDCAAPRLSCAGGGRRAGRGAAGAGALR